MRNPNEFVGRAKRTNELGRRGQERHDTKAAFATGADNMQLAYHSAPRASRSEPEEATQVCKPSYLSAQSKRTELADFG
jgi:hypothetical protein